MGDNEIKGRLVKPVTLFECGKNWLNCQISNNSIRCKPQRSDKASRGEFDGTKPRSPFIEVCDIARDKLNKWIERLIDHKEQVNFEDIERYWNFYNICQQITESNEKEAS